MRAWIAAACIACASLGGCGLFGGDDSKRAPSALVEFKAAMTPRVLWSTSIGSSGPFSLVPAIADDAIYAASADGVVARFDTAGASRWRMDVDLKISAGVASDGEVVIVGGPDGDVVGLNAADGKQRWRVKVPGELYGAPVIASGIVVLRSSDARLFALDTANGTRLWTLQRPLPPLVLRADAGMAARGDTLLASFPGGRLLAVALKTGTVRFDAAVATPRGTTELERIADVVGTPALEGSDACVAAYQGRIACVNAQNGAAVWGRDYSSAVSVAADTRFVFGVDERSVLQAFVRGTGVSMWTNDKLKDRVLGAPVSWERAVVVGDYQGYVHFLAREEGTFLARIATDGSAIRVAPRVVERAGSSFLVVQTSAGGLYAVAGQ